ncbi:MAG TPA: hypothetical protein ENG80_01595 [Nitrospirae bacterium]|nr:hypothetical protein [Nitrospirota bacterium]
MPLHLTSSARAAILSLSPLKGYNGKGTLNSMKSLKIMTHRETEPSRFIKELPGEPYEEAAVEKV